MQLGWDSEFYHHSIGVWIWLKIKELDAMKKIEYLFDDWFQFSKICNLKNKLKTCPFGRFWGSNFCEISHP